MLSGVEGPCDRRPEILPAAKVTAGAANNGEASCDRTPVKWTGRVFLSFIRRRAFPVNAPKTIRLIEQRARGRFAME